MRKHSLEKNGLSLSQAQSISNLCNQRAFLIDSKIQHRNNAEKSLMVSEEKYIDTPGKPVPENVIELLKEKSNLHAAQAFLMENIKAKDSLINELQHKSFTYDVLNPESPELEGIDHISEVHEHWGWQQLSNAEYHEYLEAESFAAHIGQYIHKNGTLAQLRKELPNIKTLEWMEVEVGKKTPMKIEVHHTMEGLADTHEKLATEHRSYEQRVNYFKAKVKNLVTDENARIARVNADALNAVNEINSNLKDTWKTARQKWIGDYKKAAQVFEETRQNEIREAAALRIKVDPRFQSVIDMFLKNVE